MQLARPTDRLQVVHAVPLLLFAVVLIGVPVVEFLSGNWPGARLESYPAVLPGLVAGVTPRRIDRDLEAHSVLTREVRPVYNELLFRAFRITTPRIAVGRDHWLFQANLLRGYPPAGTERRLRAYADAIEELSTWLAARGTRLLVLPVPNKQSIHPEQLPALEHPPRPMHAALADALRRRRIWLLDPSAELQPRFGHGFYANDTHWRQTAANRVAERAASMIRRAFPAELPGRPVDVVMATQTDLAHRGDLQRMLGFVPGSALDASFTTLGSVVHCYDVGRKAPLTCNEQEPVVVVGTSFSDFARFATLLSGHLGRRVEDRSRPSAISADILAALARDMEAGIREAPAVIVWEFPEKQAVRSWFPFLLPLQDLASRLTILRAPGASSRDLSVDAAGLRNLRLQAAPGGGYRGVPTTADPWLILRLPEPVPADGSRLLVLDVTTGQRTDAVAQHDAGDGKLVTATRDVRPVHGGAGTTRLLFRLRGQPGSRVTRVRIDPVSHRIPFTMSTPRLVAR